MHTHASKNNKKLNGIKNNNQIVAFSCGLSVVNKSSFQIAQ